MPRIALVSVFACPVVVCLLAAIAHAQPGGGPPPAMVRVGEVKRETVGERRLVIGRVEPVRTSHVAAEEAGRVTTAPPDAGTSVKLGDVLVQQDTSLLDRRIAAAKAVVVEAEQFIAARKATLDEAAQQRQRFEKLIDDGGVSQQELDTAIRDESVARAELARASAAVDVAEADLAVLETQREKMTIRAPFAGRITAKSTEQGEWLTPGGAVATLMKIDQVDILFDVSEVMVGALDAEATLQLTVPAASIDTEAKVDRMVDDADRTARTFPVYVRIDNPKGYMKPGMTARAMVPIGRRAEAITVPRNAVQITDTGAQVFMVTPNSTAAPMPVSVRFSVGNRMVVSAPGLQPGMQVVVEGNERLFPGQPLNILPPDPHAPGGEAPATPTSPTSPTSPPAPTSAEGDN